jgi:ferredoxin
LPGSAPGFPEGGEFMRAIVDPELCTGCELCVSTCPDIFEMDGDIAKTKVDIITDAAVDCARQAAEDCPATAIKIEE